LVDKQSKMNDFFIFYLTLAILLLAGVLLVLPTLVHGPKEGKSKR